MAKVWIGTSGWHYQHWRGAFYPADMLARRWLAYYVSALDSVEINSTFYRQPRATTWEAWRLAAPPGFCFAVKANRFITHVRRLGDAALPLARFLDGARRLGEHLGPVLYQTPPDFHLRTENVERLDEFLRRLPRDLRHAMEFRHASWFGEDTLGLLRRYNVAFCSYDMPGVECPLVATSSFAYLRLHGSGALYASDYTEAMLQDWATRVRKLSPGLTDVYVYFNNDAWGFAVRNAIRLAEILGGPSGAGGDSPPLSVPAPGP